jgi:hypothetical protein
MRALGGRARSGRRPLLLNILRRATAERLKAERGHDRRPLRVGDGASSRTSAGSTPLAAGKEPAGAGAGLPNQDLLGVSTGLCERRIGSMKIKTIGDAYMAVAGLPPAAGQPRRRAAADSALGMVGAIAIASSAELGEPPGCAVRVGLNTGRVVVEASIGGRESSSYDLWGGGTPSNRGEPHWSRHGPSRGVIQCSAATRRPGSPPSVPAARGPIEVGRQGADEHVHSRAEVDALRSRADLPGRFVHHHQRRARRRASCTSARPGSRVRWDRRPMVARASGTTRDPAVPAAAARRRHLAAHGLQVGLGAASINPVPSPPPSDTKLTVVEIDPLVVVAAYQYFRLPEESPRLRIVRGRCGRLRGDEGPEVRLDRRRRLRREGARGDDRPPRRSTSTARGASPATGCFR